MKKKKGVSYACFRVLVWIIWLFHPKMKVVGAENLPQEPCIIVGNHAHFSGPICAQWYLPGAPEIWCAHQMMYIKETPKYTFEDFWSKKPKWTHPFYKVLAYLITPACVCLFGNARTIPVFRDNRLMTTFKRTLAALEADTSVVIFPECYTPHNQIVYTFQNKFTDVAKLYYKRTGKALSFVPMYIGPSVKKICLGKPIVYCPDNPQESERSRLCEYLMDEITDMAENLPRHKVVPYPNVPHRKYPFNLPDEVTSNEKTRC